MADSDTENDYQTADFQLAAFHKFSRRVQSAVYTSVFLDSVENEIQLASRLFSFG